jgi:hypothetical protein
MERPTPETIAYFEAAIPGDPRAQPGQMFGHPCAFVNGNMFFGTFAQSVIIRVGEARAAALAKGKLRVFLTPRGRTWKDYLQVDAGAIPSAKLTSLAIEALDFTDRLPPKKAAVKMTASTRSAVKAAKVAVTKSAAARPAKGATAKPVASKAKVTAGKPAARKAKVTAAKPAPPAKRPVARIAKKSSAASARR